MSYIFRAVADLTDTIANEAAKQNESVIKFKSKEKKGYFFVAPSVTENLVQSFISSEKGMNAAKDWIESLMKEAGKKRFDAGLHFSAADLSIDALIAIAEATSENVRLTKENIEKAFNEGWKHVIAAALVLERDAVGATILCGEDTNAIAAYWNSESGLKFQQIASNYKSYILRGAERRPTFETEAIKAKVLAAIANLDAEEQLVQKLVEKLTDAPIATVNEDAL